MVSDLVTFWPFWSLEKLGWTNPNGNAWQKHYYFTWLGSASRNWLFLLRGLACSICFYHFFVFSSSWVSRNREIIKLQYSFQKSRAAQRKYYLLYQQKWMAMAWPKNWQRPDGSDQSGKTAAKLGFWIQVGPVFFSQQNLWLKCSAAWKLLYLISV